jgi:hypothetical protein
MLVTFPKPLHQRDKDFVVTFDDFRKGLWKAKRDDSIVLANVLSIFLSPGGCAGRVSVHKSEECSLHLYYSQITCTHETVTGALCQAAQQAGHADPVILTSD